MRHKTVPEYIAASDWGGELETLRQAILVPGLEETVKWGAPCYTAGGRNVIGLAGFKSYFGLWFHDGVELSDPLGVLINAQEGKTKRLRQWRFQSGREIRKRDVKAYAKEALEIAVAATRAPAGKTPKSPRAAAVRVPAQLQAALAGDSKAAAGFESLSPTKRREYAEYVAEAKRDATKLRRIEKILPMIAAGTGLSDRYR